MVEQNSIYGSAVSSSGDGYALYNGVKLPNIESVWTDKETYPYAMLFDMGEYGTVLYLTSKAASVDADSTPISDVNYSNYLLSDGAWTLMNTENGASTDIPYRPFWANYNVLNTDGTTHLAASDPIPLDSMTVIEWDGVTDGMETFGDEVLWRVSDFFAKPSKAVTVFITEEGNNIVGENLYFPDMGEDSWSAGYTEYTDAVIGITEHFEVPNGVYFVNDVGTAYVPLFAYTPASSEPIKYTITYTTEHGTTPNAKVVTVNQGKQYVLTNDDLPLLESDGYIFTGWSLNGEVVYSGYGISSDILLIALWEKIYPDEPIDTPAKRTTYPILYSATETNFDHNGIGILSACVSCEVTEEANGIFELAMQYPMDGVHFTEIGDRSIIKAKSDQFRDAQLFRVYAISKPMNGIVTVLAEHISYDLSGIPVQPFSADSAALALSGLKSNAVVNCPFDFWTDNVTTGEFKAITPSSIRSKLGGGTGSILDVYGGEYEFDNYTVKLHNSRGMNRGVSIRYGKNLTDIQQEQNCSNVATGVYPYWSGDVEGKTEVVELSEKIVNTPGTYNFVKIRTLDLSSEFETQPTVEQLREKTEIYIKANNIGVPIVSLTVSFAQLEQSEEYKHLKLLERVSLCDTVNVEFPALGVSATAKAVKVVYDVIADRVKSVTLGSVRANIADTIANQQQEIEKKPNKTFMQVAIESLTKTILGAKGGAVRFLDANGDGEPDTLYIADNADPEQAVKVWRFNYEGWGASENGYNGPFKLGATLNDGIVADFITAGTLYGLLFKAGAIESLDGKIKIDLESGNKPVFNTGIQTNNELVVMNEDENAPLFWVKRDKNWDGVEYFDISGFDGAAYNYVFNVTRAFNESGTPDSTHLQIMSGEGRAAMFANEGESSLMATSSAGSVQIGVNSYRNATFLRLNDGPSKDLSWQYSQELGKYVLCGG